MNKHWKIYLAFAAAWLAIGTAIWKAAVWTSDPIYDASFVAVAGDPDPDGQPGVAAAAAGGSVAVRRRFCSSAEGTVELMTAFVGARGAAAHAESVTRPLAGGCEFFTETLQVPPGLPPGLHTVVTWAFVQAAGGRSSMLLLPSFRVRSRPAPAPAPGAAAPRAAPPPPPGGTLVGKILKSIF